MTARFTLELYLTAFTSFIIVKHVSAIYCELKFNTRLLKHFCVYECSAVTCELTAYHRDIHM